LFANGTQSARETTDLLETNRSALPILLDNLVTVAQVQSIRLPAIRQILVTYPNVIAGGFTVVPNDGTTHFGLATTGNPPPCTNGGYQTTKRRDPGDLKLKTPNLNAYCASPSSTNQDVRGAQNEPRPAGERPYPNDTHSAVPPRAALDAAGRYRGAGGAQSGAGPNDGSDTVLLGDYDPATGNVITSDGQRLRIGSSAGAARLFGSSSWQLLLLGPLSP
jgi:phospholipid/cholesterol/gamma-HCH transport system substrate-binding protein